MGTLITDCANTFGISIFLGYGPVYLKYMLGLDIKTNGLLSALPMVARYVGGVVVASHPHLILHLLLPPLVMVKRMEPQYRICLISSDPFVKMFTSSCESISACFSFV